MLRGGGEYFASETVRSVAIPGNYRVTITAAGVDRDNYGKMKFAPVDGPIRMGLGVRLDDAGRTSSSELVKTFDLKDEQFESYEVVVWLEKGRVPLGWLPQWFGETRLRHPAGNSATQGGPRKKSARKITKGQGWKLLHSVSRGRWIRTGRRQRTERSFRPRRCRILKTRKFARRSSSGS